MHIGRSAAGAALVTRSACLGLILSLLSPLSCNRVGAEEGQTKKIASDRILIAKAVAKPVASISWQREFKRTLEIARTGRKWVLIDVYTDTCYWCKRLDAEVYALPQIAGFVNKSFVCMKANAEKGDGVEIAKKYGVEGYPCTLILDPSGKEKGRIFGYVNAGQFPHELVKILQRGT
ncbi:MAG: DUF255 domain-containing protein [Candidatus Obscuribacterales bacterium]|nr:DUF255 domain-containing protein [Candidatus Obscuribacterales bacterium]